jgi:uncharacterized protein YacL
MNLIGKLDDFLIDNIAQPVSNFVSARTPLTGLHVGQFLMIGAGLAIALGEILNTIWDFNSKDILTLIVLKPLDLIIAMAWAFYAFWKAWKMQAKIDSCEDLKTQTASRERLTESKIRAIGLYITALFAVIVISPFSIHNVANSNLILMADIISLVGNILFLGGLYLNACAQPPKAHKRQYSLAFSAV